MEKPSYTVIENVIVIEVCAVVEPQGEDCPVVFAFDVTLATADGDAGIITYVASLI